MHITESFALNSGLKISTPEIYEKIFPIPSNNYIFIDAGGASGQNYPLWKELSANLLEVAQKYKVDVLVYGNIKSLPHGVLHLASNKLNDNQLAFLVQNARLCITEDNFLAGLCSVYNKSVVFLEPKDNKISYEPLSQREKTRTIYHQGIKAVKPETILSNIYEILGWGDIPPLKTLWCGDFFSDDCFLEIIPDAPMPPSFQTNMVSHVRFDLINTIDANTLNLLHQNLKQKKSHLVTNKTIPLNFLEAIKPYIESIIYDVTETIDVSFAKDIMKFSEQIVFLFKKTKTNSSSLPERKLSLIDVPYGLTVQEMQEIPENIEQEWESLSFKSNRIILSNNKLYSNISNMTEEFAIKDPSAPFIENKTNNIQKCSAFWHENSRFCLFYKKG
jgi:hypothetical protein